MLTLKQMKERTFSETMEELKQSAKDLKSKREEYATLVTDSSEGEISAVVTSEKYEVEYLWIKLGNYATKNGVTLKLNVLNGTTGLEGRYDLEFILNGKYAGITEFIYEVENDATLGFRIDGFSLKPTEFAQTDKTNENDKNNDNKNTTKETKDNPKVDTEILTATFKVKDVAIQISPEQLTQNNEEQTEENTEDVQTENNTTKP